VLIDALALFSVAFLSATLFPLGSEAYLLYTLTTYNTPLLLLLIATTGNTLGSLLNYGLGSRGSAYLIERQWLTTQRLEGAKKHFDRYGGWALLGSWIPIIGDPITFIAGVTRYSLWRFLLLVTLAKGGRYTTLWLGTSALL